MDQPTTKRFEVRVEEGLSHGGLYELEQTTYFRVIDTRSQAVVLEFQGEMSASYSTSGTWDDYSFGGVKQVTVAPDEKSVTVQYHGGREEQVPLP